MMRRVRNTHRQPLIGSALVAAPMPIKATMPPTEAELPRSM